MKYIARSIAAHRSRLEAYFGIYLKPLTRFGTGDFCLNLNRLQSVESCSVFSKTIFVISFKEYYWMAKNLVAGGGVENFVLSANYCRLNVLSTFSISYHPVKAFMAHARNKDLFSIAELIVSNILSFQILYLNGRNLGQKYKTRSLL